MNHEGKGIAEVVPERVGGLGGCEDVRVRGGIKCWEVLGLHPARV